LREREQFKDLGADGKMVSKLVLKKPDVSEWVGFV
jgi:hypothetical protein